MLFTLKLFKFYIFTFSSLLRFIKNFFSERSPLDEMLFNELKFYNYCTKTFFTLKGESIKSLLFNGSFKPCVDSLLVSKTFGCEFPSSVGNLFNFIASFVLLFWLYDRILFYFFKSFSPELIYLIIFF